MVEKISELENYVTFSLDMVRFFTELNVYTNYEYKKQIDNIINGFYKEAVFFLLNSDVKDEKLSELKNIANNKLFFNVEVYWNKLMQYKYKYKNEIDRMLQYIEQYKKYMLWEQEMLRELLQNF